MKPLYFDIHTHQPDHASAWSIRNYHKDFDRVPTGVYHALGLHPWFISAATWKKDFELLVQHINPLTVAIGECGMDKVCDTPLELQEQVFCEHMHLANELGKPLIIHCVRAYNEVLAILKSQHNKVPVIFHGFNKGKELALQILQNGYYISFGADLAKDKLHETFSTLPLDRVFLETDDQHAVSIETIYNIAATIKNVDLLSFSLQLQKNVETVFNIRFQ